MRLSPEKAMRRTPVVQPSHMFAKSEKRKEEEEEERRKKNLLFVFHGEKN